MNPIIQLLKNQNVSEEKVKELFETLTNNPFGALQFIQGLGFPPEELQKMISMVMQQPALIKDAVNELGLDFSAVEKAQETMKS